MVDWVWLILNNCESENNSDNKYFRDSVWVSMWVNGGEWIGEWGNSVRESNWLSDVGVICLTYRGSYWNWE